MLLFSIHLSLNDTTNQKTKSCTHTWLSVLIATANIKQQPHARAPAHIVDSVPTSNMLIIHTEKKENKWKCPNIWIRNESRTKKKIKSFIYIYITFLPRQIAFISLTIIASISRILKTKMRETNYKSTHFLFCFICRMIWYTICDRQVFTQWEREMFVGWIGRVKLFEYIFDEKKPHIKTMMHTSNAFSIDYVNFSVEYSMNKRRA